MSQENVEIVKRAVAALNARDVAAYLACCTDDIELRTPLAAVGGIYTGADGIKRLLADVEDAAPDFHIDLENLEAIAGDRVLAFLRVSSTGRTSGISLATDITNVYDFVGGKIRRVRIFRERHEAVAAAGQAE